jgi:hypothetical protein
VSKDAAGLDSLVSRLLDLKPALAVLEATGGYEFEAACALQAAGLAVAVVDPRTARDFARAMGALAKTDALDARMLAAFTRVLHRHPERERLVKPLADAELQRLQAQVLHRRQLVQMFTAERQRMRIPHAAARPSIERVIEFLKAKLAIEVADVRGGHRQAQFAQQLRAQPLLADGLAQVQPAAAHQTPGQLQDVRGGCGPQRAAPLAVDAHEGRLFLGAGDRDALGGVFIHRKIPIGAQARRGRHTAQVRANACSSIGSPWTWSNPVGGCPGGSRCTAPTQPWPMTCSSSITSVEPSLKRVLRRRRMRSSSRNRRVMKATSASVLEGEHTSTQISGAAGKGVASPWRAMNSAEAQATSGTRSPSGVAMEHPTIATPFGKCSPEARTIAACRLPNAMSIAGRAHLDHAVGIEFKLARQFANHRVIAQFGPAQRQGFIGCAVAHGGNACKRPALADRRWGRSSYSPGSR